jgi:hypothetical protein
MSSPGAYGWGAEASLRASFSAFAILGAEGAAFWPIDGSAPEHRVTVELDVAFNRTAAPSGGARVTE